MKLYELFNKVEVSINREEFLNMSKNIYEKLTVIEKIMVDKKIIINDNYPSYYWKLIASIYYMILGKDMESISGNILIFDPENTYINSLYDLYVNFKSGYIPFRKNLLDIKLKKLRYNMFLINSVKDKMILIANDYAKNRKFKKCEIELMSHPEFVSNLNFISFYESLSNFVLEDKLHISWNKIYNIDLKTDLLFDFYKNTDKELERKNVFKSYNIMKMILSDYYEIRITDLYFILDLVRFLFKDLSYKYVNNILFICKLKGVPISIIMIYDRFLAEEYNNIDLTPEYMVSNLTPNFVNNYIYMFRINNENFVSVISNCNDFNMFKIIINKIVGLGIYVGISEVKEFIFKSILAKQNNIESIIGLIPEIQTDIIIYRDNILSLYIEILNYDSIRNITEYFKDLNVYNDRIANSVGRSCSLDMLFFMYDASKIGDSLKKNIILESCKKGSKIFLDYYVQISYTIEFNDIVMSICESSNTDMILPYKTFIQCYVLNSCIVKTIEVDNLNMFMYIWNNNNRQGVNFHEIILLTCKYNRVYMLDIILNSKFFDLKFYISIFNECTLYSNINIIGKILLYIGDIVDINLTYIQICKLGRGIINILNSHDYDKIEWLENNISISSVFKISNNSNHKKREIIRKYGIDSYVSSDDEDDLRGTYIIDSN